MLPSYPPELPAPLREGYQNARGDGRTRMAEDAGPPNVRRRFSAVANVVSFSTQLDRFQLGRFDRFYDEETKQGTLPFLMPDPGTNGWPLLSDDGMPLLTDEGTPILMTETWLCLFGQQLPAVVTVDMVWKVTFQIVVMP